MLILNYSKNLNFKLIRLNCLYSLNQLNRYLSNDTSNSIRDHLQQPFQKLPSSKIYEPFWSNVWEELKLFSIDKNDSNRDRFVMILPPPNITGDLHIGHAFTVAIEDAIIRFQKLKYPNKNVLFVPGYDHAGIGMFSVLDKLSLSKYNKRICDYTKEEFEEFTNKWKEERVHSIRNQLKILGASLDFDNEKFTLDDQMSRSVKEAFIKLFDTGLIYRDNAIVNWCFHLNSTISDIEVDWLEVDKKTVFKFPGNNKLTLGVLYKVMLNVVDSKETITVATTRPYTIPGDVAIAVNPSDDRYKHLVGKKAINPLTNRLMPIIEDYRIDEMLGTGAVKITPSCSSVDFQIAQSHNLEVVEIFDSKGNLQVNNLNNEHQHLNGLNRYKLNEEVLKILNNLEQLDGEIEHKTRVPLCSKSSDLIEYRILPQWYLKVDDANGFIKEKLLSNELNLIPSNHKNTLLDWIKYEKPWCISRQIVYGHQIPVYRFELEDNNCEWIAACSKEDAELKFKSLHKGKRYLSVEQGKDYLDTWFSSSLLPFAYFGWPNEKELQKFYPIDLMETGYDILKFWIHKMLISSYYLTGKLPFKKVLLHGMIVDANGKKMSKSLGNVIDPLDFINGSSLDDLKKKLKKFHEDGYLTKEQLQAAVRGQKKLFPKGLPLNSTDGLRLCLYQFDFKNEYSSIEVKLITKNRNYINKIWQSFNFLLFIKGILEKEQNIDLSLVPKFENLDKRQLRTIDKWILSCLNRFVTKSKMDYEDYNLHFVYLNFIHFFIDSFCSVYLELVKPSVYYDKNENVKLMRFSILKYCLSTVYSTMHPLLPFITEELFQKLRHLDCELYKEPFEFKSILQISYPNEAQMKQFKDIDLENQMEALMKCVVRIRTINKLAQTDKLNKDNFHFKIQSTDDILLDFLDDLNREIKYLSRNDNVNIDFDPPFLLDDGYNREYVVDKNLILKVNDSVQIVVSTADNYDITEMLKKFATNESSETTQIDM